MERRPEIDKIDRQIEIDRQREIKKDKAKEKRPTFLQRNRFLKLRSHKKLERFTNAKASVTDAQASVSRRNLGIKL